MKFNRGRQDNDPVLRADNLQSPATTWGSFKKGSRLVVLKLWVMTSWRWGSGC